jgi:hypothetical protein
MNISEPDFMNALKILTKNNDKVTKSLDREGDSHKYLDKGEFISKTGC